MSSLIVLCPQCLTWIETHGECCTECGTAISVDDRDPTDEVLAERLGERLLDLGPVKLLRRGWPGCGRMLVTTQGLLYLPQFTIQANGALEAATDNLPSPANRVNHLFHWWSLPAWRRPVDADGPHSPAIETIPLQPPPELLINSPGAFFIRRDSIQRIHVRWGRAQIERRPMRTVTLDQASGGPHPRDLLRPLAEFASWKEIIASVAHSR